jgi:hypothetical protein
VLFHTNGRCVYVAERNLVVCPMGKVLYLGNYTKTIRDVAFYNFVACKSCGCKCTTLIIGVFLLLYDREVLVRCIIRWVCLLGCLGLRVNKELVRLRKCLCEHPFGVVKRGFGMGYCLLRVLVG